MTKMRIAIFSNTFWPTTNGVAISIANLRRGLEKAGHSVHIFAPAPAGFDLSQDEKWISRYPAFSAPVKADYQIALPFSGAVNRVLKSEKFDLVHTQHPLWVGVWGQRYAKKMNLPLVTTIHTQYEIYSDMIHLPNSLINRYLKYQVPDYCNRCDLVTTPAVTSEKRLRKLGVTTPIEVIYNPTELAEHWQADGQPIRKKFGFNNDNIVLGYIGRISAEKNLGALLDAAEIILPKNPKVKFLLIGDGPARPALEKRVRAMNASERILFAGRVDHDLIPVYASALNLFITPSLFEVQPLSFAEAMASGAPVISFDVPCGNDMLEDGYNGRLVPPAEKGPGLARVALEVISDTNKLKLMSTQARDWAKRYDSPTVVKTVLAAYAKALELHKKAE